MITCPHSGCSDPPQTYMPSDFGWGMSRLEDPNANRTVICRRGCGKTFTVSQPVFLTALVSEPMPGPWWKNWWRAVWRVDWLRG